MTVAGVYEPSLYRISVEHSKILDLSWGGWATSAIYPGNSGTLLRFGAPKWWEIPRDNNPSKWGLMFNPNAFKTLAAFSSHQSKIYPASSTIQRPMDFWGNLSLTERFKLN
jgi:hypothetical protein